MKSAKDQAKATLIQTGLVATAYFVMAQVGYHLIFAPEQAPLIWPPEGIALAAAILFGARSVPGIFLGALAFNQSTHHVLPIALGVATGRTLEALLGAWMLRRFFSFRPSLSRISDVLALVIAGSWMTSAVGATISTLAVSALGLVSSRGWIHTLLELWLGHALGVLLLAPPLLLLHSNLRRPKSGPRRMSEAVAVSTCLALTAWFTFHDDGIQLPYLIFPFLTWATIRYERAGAVLSSLLIAGFAMWGAYQGWGSLGEFGNGSRTFFALQSFIGVVTVSGLILATAQIEHRDAQESHERLAEAHAVQSRLSFLSEASRILDSSLDHKETLNNVLRLLVPRIADYCVIALLNEEGSLAGMLSAHSDPAQEGLVSKLRNFPPDVKKSHPFALALTTHRTTLVSNIEPEFIDRIANSQEHAAVLHALNPISYLAVPLIEPRGDRLLGVLTLMRTPRSGAHYGKTDVALAEDLARRCANSIRNTSLYQAEKQLVQAREDTLAIVSHDLKNPISTVLISSKLMEVILAKAEVSEQDKIRLRQLAKAAQQSAENGHHLVEDLLEFAKLKAGTFAISKERQQVTSFVDEAASLFRALAEQKRIALETRTPGPACEAYCDRQRIYQVLSNLIGNSIKFTQPGGKITVTAEKAGSEVVFMVEDDGPGIPKEALAHIFERYWQPKESMRFGMGLGLAIAREFVLAHGGRIWAESEVGRGSRFFFALPCAEEARKTA
jgi:signal transduction histidine kinase/integral membrane sensor domain MASE1